MTALLLLGPGTPMLFQGQEFASESLFYYFADFEGELKRLVREGRGESLAQFRGLATPEMQAALTDPGDAATFGRSKLDFAGRERHANIYQLHRDLLRLRRTEPVFRAQQQGAPRLMDGAVLDDEAFVLRFFGDEAERLEDRLLLVNLGVDLILNPAPEPLLAPPPDHQWKVLWSSEDPRYGGLGTPPLETTANWLIPGHAAVVLQPAVETTLPAPFGRTMMLNQLSETLHLPDGTVIALCGEEGWPDSPEITVAQFLAEFRLERGLPVWRFEIGETVLEKHVLMPHRQNTVQVSYKMLAGPGPVKLELRPALYLRPHEGRVDEPLTEAYTLLIVGDRYEIISRQDHPPLRLRLLGGEAALTLKRDFIRDLHYRVEARRGYDAQGVLWSPGYFTTELSINHTGDRTATLIASSEAWATVEALPAQEALVAERERRERLLAAAPPQAQGAGMGAELVLAADQFIILPAGRVEEAARARAAGDEVRTVIAGYHWFTDWGRDTMISLEGLTLATNDPARASRNRATPFEWHAMRPIIKARSGPG